MTGYVKIEYRNVEYGQWFFSAYADYTKSNETDTLFNQDTLVFVEMQ